MFGQQDTALVINCNLTPLNWTTIKILLFSQILIVYLNKELTFFMLGYARTDSPRETLSEIRSAPYNCFTPDS